MTLSQQHLHRRAHPVKSHAEQGVWLLPVIGSSHQLAAAPLRPTLQLLSCCGSERVTRSQHHLLTAELSGTAKEMTLQVIALKWHDVGQPGR